jgi:hypothetical protein
VSLVVPEVGETLAVTVISFWHVEEQPSPDEVFPSSHCSSVSTVPFPHIGTDDTVIGTSTLSVIVPLIRQPGMYVPALVYVHVFVLPDEIVDQTSDVLQRPSSDVTVPFVVHVSVA